MPSSRNLRRWLAGLLLAAAADPARAQQFAPPPRAAGLFDSVTTSAQAQRLVNRWRRARQRSDFYYPLTLDSLGADCAGQLPCAPRRWQSWVKADFDGNGLPDLAVLGSGPHDSSQELICLLDSGRQTAREIRLDNYGTPCATLQLGYVGRQPVLRYAHAEVNVTGLDGRWSSVCLADTLIYRQGGFVEYNPAPRDFRIEQVELATTTCMGTCPAFRLRLDAAGPATYEPDLYGGQHQRYAATLGPAARQAVWDLLNYLNFPALRRHYSLPATDYPTATLTITYAGGQVKTVEDYGQMGTRGLQHLYALLFALRTSQPWQ